MLISPRHRRPTTGLIKKGSAKLWLCPKRKRHHAVSLTNPRPRRIVASGVALGGSKDASATSTTYGCPSWAPWARMPSARRWARSSAAFWPTAWASSSTPTTAVRHGRVPHYVRRNSTSMLCVGIVIRPFSAGVPSSWSYPRCPPPEPRRQHRHQPVRLGPASAVIFSSRFCSFVFPPRADGALSAGGHLRPSTACSPCVFCSSSCSKRWFTAWNLQRKLEESKDWTEKQDAAAGKRDTFIQMMGRALTNSVNVKSIVFLPRYLTWKHRGQTRPVHALHVRGGRQLGRHDHLASAGGHVDPHGRGLACHLLEVRRQDSSPHPVRGHGCHGAGGLGGHGVLRHAAGGGHGHSWGYRVFVAPGISVGFSAQCFYAPCTHGAVPDAPYRGGGVQGIMFFLVRGVLGIWSLVVRRAFGETLRAS